MEDVGLGFVVLKVMRTLDMFFGIDTEAMDGKGEVLLSDVDC